MRRMQATINHVSLLFSLIMSIHMLTLGQSTHQLKIQVDAQNITHQMKGGIGASWHALIHDIPLENEKYDYPVRHVNPRGSAYAGNPPLADVSCMESTVHTCQMAGIEFCSG